MSGTADITPNPWTSRIEAAGDDMVAITLPADMLASLGWKEGDLVEIDAADGLLIIGRTPTKSVDSEITPPV